MIEFNEVRPYSNQDMLIILHKIFVDLHGLKSLGDYFRKISKVDNQLDCVEFDESLSKLMSIYDVWEKFVKKGRTHG